MEQGTPEWFDAKRGKASASHIVDIMAKGKSGKSSGTRRQYMAKLLIERLTGETEETYTNAAMQNGIDQEPFARATYEAEYGVDVVQVGFIESQILPNFGASPDGLVSDDGGIEIKCPSHGVHLEYLRSRVVPRDYLLQMHGGMMCTDRVWWDWVSYDKAFPAHLRMLIIRVDRDDDLCVEISKEVRVFNTELDLLEKEMRG